MKTEIRQEEGLATMIIAANSEMEKTMLYEFFQQEMPQLRNNFEWHYNIENNTAKFKFVPVVCSENIRAIYGDVFFYENTSEWFADINRLHLSISKFSLGYSIISIDTGEIIEKGYSPNMYILRGVVERFRSLAQNH